MLLPGSNAAEFRSWAAYCQGDTTRAIARPSQDHWGVLKLRSWLGYVRAMVIWVQALPIA